MNKDLSTIRFVTAMKQFVTDSIRPRALFVDVLQSVTL